MLDLKDGLATATALILAMLGALGPGGLLRALGEGWGEFAAGRGRGRG